MADFAADFLVQFGGAATTTYYKRGDDNGLPSPAYVYWETTDPAGAYPGVPVGAIVDETIIDEVIS